MKLILCNKLNTLYCYLLINLANLLYSYLFKYNIIVNVIIVS